MINASEPAVAFVRTRHRLPSPRVAVGRLLSQWGPDVITALLDVSDGLSGDLEHLCSSSGVGARLDLAGIPISLELRTVAAAAQVDPLLWALHGGEDYELLFTVAPKHVQEVLETVPARTGVIVNVIGQIGDRREGLYIAHADGQTEPLVVSSWDHFKSQKKDSNP